MNVTSTPPKTITCPILFGTPSSLGNNVVLAAQGTGSIRVLGLAVVTTLANNVKFQSNSSDITGTFPLAANGGLVLPFNEHGWFQTAAGEGLNINLSVATATAYQIIYIVLPN